jgi:hypothetical protein
MVHPARETGAGGLGRGGAACATGGKRSTVRLLAVLRSLARCSGGTPRWWAGYAHLHRPGRTERLPKPKSLTVSPAETSRRSPLKPGSA